MKLAEVVVRVTAAEAAGSIGPWAFEVRDCACCQPALAFQSIIKQLSACAVDESDANSCGAHLYSVLSFRNETLADWHT